MAEPMIAIPDWPGMLWNEVQTDAQQKGLQVHLASDGDELPAHPNQDQNPEVERLADGYQVAQMVTPGTSVGVILMPFEGRK